MIGKRLAHYEITAKIGAGGMGDVYRARDTKLSREVALKLLPPEFARNPERRKRFEREASAIAALRHPNIVTIHSMEESEGVHFLTMELIEGRTLAEVIPEDGLRLERFLEIAIALSDAICCAHESGITHRDLKPANIMLDSDDRVKVLDFGLAKLAQAEPESARTLTSDDHTEVGQILGTISYMSPEQAQGQTVDHRSDIFSLGIVLYEMATGRHPFRKETNVSTLSAILTASPSSVVDLNGSCPPELDAIVERCLAKDPDRRYPSVAGLRDELQALETRTGTGHLVTAGPAGPLETLRQKRVAVPAAVLLLGIFAATAWLYRRTTKARWTRQVALPEIERLVDAAPWTGSLGTWEAFQLAREAKRYVPGDPLLNRLEERCSNLATIRTDPPGARVFAKPYGAVSEEWELLGETPIDSLRYVSGVLRVRIEKDGYEPLHDLYVNLSILHGDDLGYVLREQNSVPEGMVWVSGTALKIAIRESYQGLHMPGLEHLEPREVGDFFIDRHEVTNREYKEFVDAGGYENPEFWKEPFVADGRSRTWEEAIARFTDRTSRPGPAAWEVGDYPDGTDDYPVSGISWYEAAAYAEFAGKSLPTIYHWNRVALTWGSADIVPLSNLTSSGLVATGSTDSMNRFGAYDLSGNVREWCANATERGDRFILGGGWNDPAYAFNDAYAQSPWDRAETNGVRCIRYSDGSVDRDAVQGTIDLPFRDLLSEPRVSDETFALYLSQFQYDRTPLNPVVEGTRTEEDYVREKIAFDAAYGGERMAAYLFLPKKGSPPYQTVVYFPGSGSIHTRSSESLALRTMAFVPKSGRALIFPVFKSTYERGDGLASVTPNETANWRDHVVMWVKDLSRSIDYLETREDLDSDRLAYLGASWGAAMGPFMMAAEPRLKAGVVLVAGLHFQRALPEASEVNYVPRVTIPVLMLNGKYDFFFPYETSQLPYYELLGTPQEHKKLVLHETGHAFPNTDMVRETLTWLDEYLGPVD